MPPAPPAAPSPAKAPPTAPRPRRDGAVRRAAWTVAALVALLVAVVLSLAVGARTVAPGTVVEALFQGPRARTPRWSGRCGCRAR